MFVNHRVMILAMTWLRDMAEYMLVSEGGLDFFLLSQTVKVLLV